MVLSINVLCDNLRFKNFLCRLHNRTHLSVADYWGALKNFYQVSVLFGEKKIADGGQVDPTRDVQVIFCSYTGQAELGTVLAISFKSDILAAKVNITNMDNEAFFNILDIPFEL